MAAAVAFAVASRRQRRVPNPYTGTYRGTYVQQQFNRGLSVLPPLGPAAQPQDARMPHPILHLRAGADAHAAPRERGFHPHLSRRTRRRRFLEYGDIILFFCYTFALTSYPTVPAFRF